MGQIHSLKQWCPIKRIFRGLIELKNGDFCKVLEVFPINFALKSEREQEQILYQYKTFLRTCDFPMQILVLSKRYDIGKHIRNLEEKGETERSLNVRKMIGEYVEELKGITENKAIISRKFYLVFREKGDRAFEEIERNIDEKVLKIKNALKKTGNEVEDFGTEDREIVEILYGIFNRDKSRVSGKELLTWTGL